MACAPNAVFIPVHIAYVSNLRQPWSDASRLHCDCCLLARSASRPPSRSSGPLLQKALMARHVSIDLYVEALCVVLFRDEALR